MKQLALDVGLPVGPTLDNYLAGDNDQALQHLRAAVTQGGGATAPIYLWGEAGTGKSHLLRGAAQALRERGAHVGWLDASVAQPHAFDEGWNAVAMDDVHRYTTAQQATAFNWFVNAASPATGAARWVLAAGRLPPADLSLRDDLRSRLAWGLVFELRPLDEAARRTVLRTQAQARGLALSDEVLNFMLARFARDLGSLARLLGMLDQFALRAQRAITIPLLRAMLEADTDKTEAR